MKKAILTGATGMIGGLILDLCLESDQIESVRSLVRKPSGKAHPRLEEIVVKDFLDLAAFQDAFKDIEVAYYCIGVYTGQVDKEDFRKITVDYPTYFGKMLKQHSPDAVFCLLSGAGADRSEKSNTMFARDKGAAENVLSALEFKSFHAFRPAYIYPVAKRKDPNLMYSLSRLLYPVIRLFGENASIKSTELASSMFKVGLKGGPEEILENKDILKRV